MIDEQAHEAIRLTLEWDERRGYLMPYAVRDKLRAAYESAKQKGEAEGWRPIESAPKDGTEILACSEPAGTGTMLVRYIAMVDFLTDAEIEEYVREGASDSMLEKADWFHADFLHGDRLSPDCYPTKWRPLPEPPMLSAGGEG